LKKQLANIDTDAETLKGLSNRNPAAIASLYEQYRWAVYSIAIRILQHSGEAEEIVQEVFLRVWTRGHLFDGSRGALSTWILTVARNLAFDTLRSAGARRSRRCEHTYYQTIAAPDDSESKDRLEQVRAAFSDLTSDQRMVIESAYFEGLTQVEIAERMQKPLGTVKTWARSAISALRKSAIEVHAPANGRRLQNNR
jgi:RNA polymerase sigma-70 factor (ECF subfamily)